MPGLCIWLLKSHLFSGETPENINAEDIHSEDIQSEDDKIAVDTISNGVRYSFRLHHTEDEPQAMVSVFV